MNSSTGLIFLLTLFAIAMILIEDALIGILRYYPDSPQTVFPLILMFHRDPECEIDPEAATVVMLLCVVWIVEWSADRRFAAFLSRRPWDGGLLLLGRYLLMSRKKRE